MFTAARRTDGGGGGAAASIFASFLLHGGIIAAFLALRAPPPPATPPFYKVNLVAAPTSEAPAAGVVQPKVAPPPDATKVPPRPKTNEVAPTPLPASKTVEKRATPGVSDKRVDRNAPAAVAGGGEQGSTGADVTTIRTEGIDFPYPGYLDNIVRQIRLLFKPPPRTEALKAEVMFLIKRDGSITGFRFTQRSGAYTFDLEVQGAVEAAAAQFGPLPKGFSDDVLPVMFSFDPRLIRR